MALKRKIAFIDLSKEKINISPISYESRQKYLGGQGLGTCLLYTHTTSGKKTLSTGNTIAISAGLLGGTVGTPSVNAYIIVKSPLTNAYSSTPISGPFASELRWAGFDHLVIKGKAKRPVYLFLKSGTVTIKNAAKLVKAEPYKIQARIRKELKDQEVQIVLPDQTDFDTAFKSKNLVAVACKGNLDIEIKNPNDAIALGRNSIARIKTDKEKHGPDKETVQVRPVKNSESQLYLRRALGCLGIDPVNNSIIKNGSISKDFIQLIQCNTGENITQRKLKEIGKRCFTVERLFNLREHVSLQKELDNTQPDDIESLKKVFYQSGEWKKDGTPVRELLERLKISDLWPNKQAKKKKHE